MAAHVTRPSGARLPAGVSLQKAELRAYVEPGGDEIPSLSVAFFLNPSTLTVTHRARLERAPVQGHTAETRWCGADPGELTLGELWFDGYETRTNVREAYVERLERLMAPWAETGHVPCVRLVWGAFTQRADAEVAYTFYVESLKVDYTVFAPDGAPLRARVALGLRQVWPVAAQQRTRGDRAGSEARVHRVTGGETLQAVAAQAYGDPRAWRAIADANDLDDPMHLPAGATLLLPARPAGG